MLSTFTPADGWTRTTTDDGKEQYLREHGLAQVVAEWDPNGRSGTISVQSSYHGFVQSHVDTVAIHDPSAFWIAANLAADTIAAPLPVMETMKGEPEVTPEGTPLEADIRFRTDADRLVLLTVTEKQIGTLGDGFYRLEKYAWPEERQYADDSDDDTDIDLDEDLGLDEEPADPLPAGEPSNAYALMSLLESRFGLATHELMIQGDMSVFLVIGEERMRILMDREEELVASMGSYWHHEYSQLVDLPCLVIRQGPA
jgi:hypothetical protein